MRTINNSNNQNNNSAESCNTKRRMFCKIREYDFAILETALFLNTHPNNRKALRYYSKLRDERKALVYEYENKYEPITLFGNMNDSKWDWISNPWPWEGEN